MIATVTAHDDLAPVPRVEIRVEPSVTYDGGAPGGSFPELSGGTPAMSGPVLYGGTPSTAYFDVPEGTNRVTLWRRCEGRTLKVRGGVDRFFGGSIAILDLEAGLETVSSYELECFQGSANLGRVLLGDTYLPWAGEPGEVLLQQPLDPRLNAVVLNLQGSWPQISRNSASQSVFTQGQQYPTLVADGPMRAITGMAVDFGVRTREQAAKVWETLGGEGAPQLPVWLVRSPKGLLPRVFFGHVSILAEVDIDLRVGGEWSRFQASLDEIAPPAPALLTASLTYADLGTAFPTYSELGAEFLTYSAMGSAFEYAGAAGG